MTTTFKSTVVDRPAMPAQQRPMYAAPPVMPQAPIYVQAGPNRSGNAAMALVVLLLAVLAAGAGYLATTASAPSAEEAARLEALAGNQAFRTANTSGFDYGRQYGFTQQQQLNEYRTAIQNQRSYNRGFNQGRKAGARLPQRRATRSYGYRGTGYRGPNYYRGGNFGVTSALADAQRLADATGSPVDVEIF